MRITLSTVATALLLVSALPAAAWAADRKYDTGGTDNNWSTAANWFPDDVPDTASENAIINVIISPGVDLDNDFTIGNLTIGEGNTLRFLDGSDLSIAGSTIQNEGAIRFNSTGSPTSLFLTQDTTYSGGSPMGGSLRLGGNANNRITSLAASPPSLISDAGIFGGGQVGADGITVINHGNIRADIDGVTLTVDPADDPTLADDFLNEGYGVLAATHGGSLVLDGNGGGTFSNIATAGRILAEGKGSYVGYAHGAILKQSTTTTLNGGVYSAIDGGSISLPGVPGGITSLGKPNSNPFITQVALGGQNSTINFADTPLHGSLTTNNGHLAIGDHTFRATHDLTNNGIVDLDDGGKITTDTFTQTTNGTLLGKGTLEANVFLSGTTYLKHPLTIKGNLTLDAQSILFFQLDEAGVSQDASHIDVMANNAALPGNLVLDGEFAVEDHEDFGIGTYTLLSFTGALTDNGLEIISMPDGYAGSILTTPAGAGPGLVQLIVTPVPEPGTAALALLGLGGVMMLGRPRLRGGWH